VLVGTDTRDDAAVYLLDEDRALVCTTDFFTPVVDDAYAFGQIAAANALSDVYAMGARPLFALSLVGFPARKLPMSLLGDIVRGGSDKVSEAGIFVVGGHSIDDPEPKYGLVVVGMVHPDQLLRNTGARPGDRLILTKPLGTGVVTTAVKKRWCTEAEIDEVVGLMSTLNRDAAEVLVAHRPQVHALTDVTGFGLLGHLLEILEGSSVGARLDAGAVPILDSARELAVRGAIPGGTRANLASASDRVRFAGSLAGDEALQLILADAQTSGGLLAAVAPGAVDAVMTDLSRCCQAAAIVGEVVEGDAVVEVR